MTCASCGYANREGIRFCEECGKPLTPRCATCGAELPATARFCGECGTAVEADPVSTAGGSLKVVSVIFSDLVGSTALQESLDAESVRRVMTRFYEAMRGVVETHDGELQKFIGDAVIAAFGAPVVREDDALRAVRCAMAMTQELHSLNDELKRTWGVRLQMRTGVNTGELVVNDEGILVGDTMNTAARLEQSAGAGHVLIGEATWRLVRNKVELEEVAPLDLKGKAAPVRAWQVVSVAGGVTASAVEAPLIGRDAELGRLRAALRDAIDSQACRLVSVIGLPGLGKSRLAQEFASAPEAEARVLVGHCEPTGEGITFLPVAEVLRSVAEIGEADAPNVVIDKLAELVPDDPDRRAIAERAAALLGAGESASPEETFWSVRRVLEAAARRQPLVLVLDDVHWGQPMFLDLVEHLVEWVRDAPILIIALARPELRETREALAAAGRRPSDVIELEPLEPGESRELVDGLLGEVDLGTKLLERILETTEGNPLFLGELLRMLVEDGSLERVDDVWVAAGGAEAVHVPPTIQALLTARIERLRPDERTVVERAAVIGKQFYRGAVAELVAPPIRIGIDGHLEMLRRKDMVEPEGTYWIDEPVYRFHHVLIRDAAYHLLLKEARAELHEKFADWLETKAGELVGEHEEVIAYHLEQAHEYRRQLGPLDDRGQAIGARAASMFTSAGQRALAREDLAAAANLLQRALDRDPETDVHWDLGEALLSAGDTARAAAVIAKLSGPRGAVLDAQLAVLTGSGSLEQVLGNVIAATDQLAAADDSVGEAKGHHVTAQVQAQLGQVAAVETALDRALLAGRKADDRRRVTAVLAAAPRAALWGPSPVVRASGRCLDVVRILRMTPGNRHVEAVALRCQAVLEAMRGRAGAAREILAAGRTTLEELGLTLELHELSLHAGIVELLAGDPSTASELLASARDGFAALGVSVSAAQAAALLGRALVEEGGDDEALAETEYAEQHAGGDLKTTITWLGVRAEALARRGEIDLGLQLARRAVALAEPTDALADKADANMALARVLRGARQIDQSRAAAEAARSLYEAKDHAVGVQRANDLTSRTTKPAPADEAPRAAVIHDPDLAAATGRYSRAWEERDLEGLLACVSGDWVSIDHRELGRGELTDHEAQIRSMLNGTREIRFCIDEVVAEAPGVIAVRAAWRGYALEANIEFELPVGYVATVKDGRLTRTELFEPDAETSIRACFEDLRGRTLLGDRPPERYWAQWVDGYGRHDRAAIEALWASEIVFVDHRQLAWEEARGRDPLLEIIVSSWQMIPDGRAAVDEVLACDDRVIATRATYLGSGQEGGGQMELPVGYVAVWVDGVGVETHQFDPDDREGMLRCYAELGGTREPVLGDSPPERLWAAVAQAFDDRDLDRLVDLFTDDVVMIDHRRLPWEDLVDREGVAKFAASGLESSPDLRLVLDEVLAVNESVMAVRLSWRGSSAIGGGEMVNSYGQVFTVRDGRCARFEVFDSDAEISMRACFAELRAVALLGDRPPERWWKKFVDRYGQRDREGLEKMYAEDFTLVDHRALAWEEIRGRDALVEVVESSWQMAPDLRCAVDEVLACGDSISAVRCTFVGAAADGGGLIEIPTVYLSVFDGDIAIRGEQFDPDDREGILRRCAELGGTRGVALGDRPIERVLAEQLRNFNDHDLERAAELMSDEIEFRDHRSFGSEPLHGHAPMLEYTRSIFEIAPDVRREFEEVIACDDHVIALRAIYRGSSGSDQIGSFEVENLEVWAEGEGKLISVDLYEADDTQAAIARLAELGGRHEVAPDSSELRPYEKFDQLYNERRLDELPTLYTDDYVMVDRRSMAWEEIRGPEAIADTCRSFLEQAPDLKSRCESIVPDDGGDVVLLRNTFTGHGVSAGGAQAGEVELVFIEVGLLRGGLFALTELFDEADVEAARARFEELRVGRGLLGDTPAERVVARYLDLVRRRDIAPLLELAGDDVAVTDHRALGGPPASGPEAALGVVQSALGVTSELHYEVEEVLERSERVLAMRGTWIGIAAEGEGEIAVPMAIVASVTDGRIASLDLYERGEESAIRQRHKELTLATLNPYGKWDLLFNERRWDELKQLFTDDYVLVDRRQVGWDPIEGPEELVKQTQDWVEQAPGQRSKSEPIEDDGGDVTLYRITMSGEEPVAWEWAMCHVVQLRDGLTARVEIFDQSDEAAARARYEELRAGHD